MRQVTLDDRGLRLDLGCGGAKRDGHIGIDCVDLPGVDHVIDLTRERLPFDDSTVDAVHSSHFLEHIDVPDHVLGEIGRVCRDGATIELWTPYAFSAEAFVYGHKTFLTELPWLQFCVTNRDAFASLLNGMWLLHRVVYVVKPETRAELEKQRVPIAFAIKYFKGVVEEFGVEMEYQSAATDPPRLPLRVWSHGRRDSPCWSVDDEVAAYDRAPERARRALRTLRALRN